MLLFIYLLFSLFLLLISFQIQSPLKILFDLSLHFLFYLVFVLLYLLLFVIILSQRCRVKTNSFILSFSLDIYENTFFRLLFFRGTCLKFYLIALLICYLYSMIYRRAYNFFGTEWRVGFLEKFVAAALAFSKK